MARASRSSEGGGKFGIFECGDERQSPGAGEATFSIQLSSSAFRESSKSVKATPCPFPFWNLAPLRSMPIRLCSNGCQS